MKSFIKNVYVWGILGGIILLLIKKDTLVLTATAVIVFFYTYETYKMRNEMVSQNKNLSNQLRLQTFSEYTKRYQDIILHFPEQVNDDQFNIRDLPPEKYEATMRYMRAYFDLCFEEFWLHEKGFVDGEWWDMWKGGMTTAFSRPAFRDAWEIVRSSSKFGDEFLEFVNRELLK
jgi:hypothetical protein